MSMKSYRKMRVRELKDGIRNRHKLAGELVERSTKLRTPVGTPATTGKPNYVSQGLRESIRHRVLTTGDGVEIGTSKPYAKYVHNGTGPGFRGRDEWSEAEAAEWFAIYLAQYPGYTGPHSPPDPNDDSPFRGMKPRAFLVNGLLKSKQGLKGIYGKSIIGAPPYG